MWYGCLFTLEDGHILEGALDVELLGQWGNDSNEKIWKWPLGDGHM